MKHFMKNKYVRIGAILLFLIIALSTISFYKFKKENNSKNVNYLANYDPVIPGEKKIEGTNFVTFDAFFLEDLNGDGIAEGIRGEAIEIGDTKKLYLELQVSGDVLLKNGKISFLNSNVRVAGTLKKGSLVNSNYTSSDFATIDLATLNNGLTVTKPLNVYSKLTNDLTSYNAVNKVVLTGTLTDLYGNKITDIEKEVPYTVDWYGDNIRANLSGSGKFSQINPHQSPEVNYTITASETVGQLFLKTFYMEGMVSQLNGRDPLSVDIYGTGINSTYDPQTRQFTIRKDAELNGTLITKPVYDYKNDLIKYNDIRIRVTYPYNETDEEGFTSVSVSTWYDAFNNQGDSFTTVKSSDKVSRIISASFVNRKPGGTEPIDARSEITVGSKSNILGYNYVDKTEVTSIYNGATLEESYEDYRVSWGIKIPSVINDNNKGGNTYTLVFDDNDGDKLNNELSIKDYVSYKTISLSNLNNALNENGSVSVINADTNETVYVFNKENWNTQYTFTDKVHSIRLAVNGFNYINYGVGSGNYRNQLGFSVYMVKTIDNNLMAENIDRDAFKLYGSITSRFNMRGYNGNEPMNIYDLEVNSYAGVASYVNAESQAYLSVNRSQIYTTEESEVIFTITTNDIDDISRGYQNGEYMILLPEEILDAKLVSLTPNNDNIHVDAASVGMLSNGRKYIKVITSNEQIVKYNIQVKAKILPDPTKTDRTINYTLYSYNPNCHNYRYGTNDIYDMNGNNDIAEKVSYNYASMSISAPNEMITTSMITRYNGTDATVVAPMIAEVNPVEDDSEATISLAITNNSEFSVKNVNIIGKVAYYENTYQIGEGLLGSEYNVQMTNDGITAPDSLVGKVKIYYSEVETPTEDLNLNANGWTTKENTDFSKVKSYLIVIDDYEMPVGQSLVFTYDIDMPLTTANINKVTYFTHGVYYDLVTDSGLHHASVGGSKLGIRMSRQYDLKITNLKPYSDRKIDGSKYVLTDDEGTQIIVNTNNNGEALVEDLYADKEYKLKQMSVKSPYIVDAEEKTILITNNAQDELVNASTGTFKSIEFTQNGVLNIVHESEVRYNVKLKNTDLDSNVNIIGANFKLTGRGYEDGIILTTNKNGEISLKNLYLNERYYIEQLSTDGYIKLKNKFIIDLVRNSENGNVEITVTKVPSYEIKNNRVYSGYCGFDISNNNETNPYERTYQNESGCRYYTGKWIYNYIHVDLTGFKEQYELSYDVSWNDSNHNSYMYTWIFDDKSVYNSSPSTALTHNPSIIINSANYNGNSVNGTFTTNEVTKLENGEYVHKPFMGGQPYDIIFFYYKAYNYDNFQMKHISIKPVSGIDEQVATSEVNNVPLVNNQNILQSIVDNDNIDAPELTVNVKSKKIPTYTLEINKVDAETNEALAGAQFKVTGPGLPTTGKYLTTDQNGKATIELNKKYNHLRVNDIDYSDIESIYTIEEVVAPVGYMIDTKKIVINGQQMLSGCSSHCSQNICTATCDMNQKNYTFITYDGASETQFKSYSYDENTNTIKAYVQDFPIVKVVKKDGETGELLPNTLFSVELIKEINGVRTYAPALDANNKKIGTELNINGNLVYVVLTDANGSLKLNLPAGQYRIKEVQAADDKYEISDAEYFFGIGETVPYQEDGIKMIGGTLRSIDNPMSGYIMTNVNYLFKGLNGNHNTKDGGYIEFSEGLIKKHKADGSLEWSSSPNIEYWNTSYIATYYDRPGVEDIGYGGTCHDCGYSKNTYTPSSVKIVETTDGYYISLGRNTSYHDWVIKMDEDGNIVWQNDNSATYYRYLYVGINEQVSDPNYFYYRDENTSYSTSYTLSYYVNQLYGKIADIAVDKDGNLLVFVGYIYNSSYNDNAQVWEYGVHVDDIPYVRNEAAFRLKDGTYYFPNQNYNTYQNTYLLKYASDGSGLYEVMDYQEKLNEGLEKYKHDHNLTGTTPTLKELNAFGYPQYTYIGVYDDNSLLLKNYYTWNFKYNDSNTQSTSFYLKLKPNGDVDYLVPTGVNGAGAEVDDNNLGTDPVILNNETGGFTVGINYVGFQNIINLIRYNAGYSTYGNYDEEFFGTQRAEVPTYHDLENNALELPRPGSYIFNYDGDGMITDAVLITSNEGNEATEYMFGDNILGILHNSTLPAMYKRTNDGKYIVAMDLRYDEYNHPDNKYKVRLRDGTVKTLEVSKDRSTFVIMKVNKHSEIEWIKSFYSDNSLINGNNTLSAFGISYSTSYASIPYSEIVETEDHKLIIPYRLQPHSSVHDNTNNLVVVTNDTDDLKWAYLEFELSDKIEPSGPEAYSLEIENHRKEFKINASSNTGGTISAKPANTRNVISTTGELTTLETIKYGDDNEKDITITPADNYVISNITLNDKPVDYTVEPDGSVTLDKISDIKSDQNLRVTYAKNKAQVIVKHYKEGTTDSVFSDDILIGDVGDPYVAESKADDVYSLVTDENGEPILPANMEDFFKSQTQTVIFYYKENDVVLKVNHYINGTSTEVAPSTIEHKKMGDSYETSAVHVDFYELTKTVGTPKGTLNKAVTEVTYMYSQTNYSKITTYYKDKDTNEEIAPQNVQSVLRNSNYTTSESDQIPANYRFVSKTDNDQGPAILDTINVTYYYEKIPFNINVDKKIKRIVINGSDHEIDNNKKQTITVKDTDEVVVYYDIIVTNDSDLKTTYQVIEKDINNFNIYDKQDFTDTGSSYVVTGELEANKTITYHIAYKWNQKDFGISENKIEVINVNNELGFSEYDPSDNTSSSTIEVVESTIIEEIEKFIPNTADKLFIYIMLLISSLLGLTGTIILVNKKRVRY